MRRTTPQQEDLAAPVVPERVQRFLNALPTSGDILSWLQRFRDELRHLLGDVDRVMVDVNYLCDLNNPHAYQPRRSLAQHVSEHGDDVLVVLDDTDEAPQDRLIRMAARRGFRPDEYHPPAIFEYRYQGTAYLGVILLWCGRSGAPVSQRTRTTMESLEPFMIFLFSDLVARHHYAEPTDRGFHEVLERIARDLKLSEREQQVLAFHLFGFPYQEIADQIHLGIDSVRKHVKAIHRKAGVRTFTELFGKYLAPNFSLRSPRDGSATK